MSYAAAGLIAGAPPECVGGPFNEYSDGSPGGDCCPWKTWSNKTYLRMKGEESLRFHNEKRILAVFAYLQAPTPGGSADPIDQFAYDRNLVVPTNLRARIRKAASIFSTKYPLNRWRKVKHCIQDTGRCSRDGWWSCWQDTGKKSYPNNDVVRRVLYGAGQHTISQITKAGDKPERYFDAVDGRVKPKPWLEELLKAFSTYGTIIKSPSSLTIRETLSRRPSGLLISKAPVLESGSESSKPDEPSTARRSGASFLALGLLAIGGVAVFVYSRGR